MCIRDSEFREPRAQLLGLFQHAGLVGGHRYDDHLVRRNGRRQDEPLVVAMSPVSYTHLDVYKRQGLNNISTDIYEAAEIDGASGLGRIRYITLPLLHNTLCTCLVPVSYTHLDVYKRQARDKAARPAQLPQAAWRRETSSGSFPSYSS